MAKQGDHNHRRRGRVLAALEAACQHNGGPVHVGQIKEHTSMGPSQINPELVAELRTGGMVRRVTGVGWEFVGDDD